VGLDPPPAPQPPASSQPIPSQASTIDIFEAPAPPAKPEPPKPDGSRSSPTAQVPPTDRRTSQATLKRNETLITLMTIDLDARRVALSSPEGPPVRGDVSTDLGIGFYTLKVDRQNKQWVFDAGQVPSGLRFHVALIGADPFDLRYPDNISLIAQRGFQSTGPETFKAVKERVVQAVSDRQYVTAFGVLDLLGEVDLYDVVDELWID
jgi:hypothetical protein